MPIYNYLPGVLVNTVDGGLAGVSVPKAHSTLVVGTAGQGPVNQPYQVTNRATAAQLFGLSGNLIRAQEELAAHSDNIILFRYGTSPQVLANVGKEITVSPTPGFTITFGQVTATSATDYTIWYGLVATVPTLTVYYLGSPVFSNQATALVDTGDISITASGLTQAAAIVGNTGLQLGTGTTPSATNAITISAAALLTPGTDQVAPTLTPANTGLGMTGQQAFIAFKQALNLLQGYQVEQIIVPDATLDAPNVAFYLSSPTTAINNPVTNPNALDWLLTTYDTYGNPTFQWASQTINSAGATVPAMSAVTPAARLAAGFREVNWGYEIANFCVNTSTLNKTCIGFIGTSAPANYSLASVRKWIGFLPQYDGNGNPDAAGYGLLGIPYLVGTPDATLNPLCYDYANGYRLPGFFQTTTQAYDGVVVLDENGNPVDIGSYLHVVADQAILSNGYATNYLTNIANYVAGFCSMLDQKTALTNSSLPVIQLPGLRYTPAQLDALTEANINVLRYKGAGVNPALLHDYTAASSLSDYTELLRVRIKGLVIETLLSVADPFIGGSSLDGLQLTALVTALNASLANLNKRGYLSNPKCTVTTTKANALLGHASINVTFHPADELIQLTANVGLNSGS